MKRRKITCLSMALIISTLLTGCSTEKIPVIGKLMNKDANTTDVASDGANSDNSANTDPIIDAEYPPVAVGTVITIDDIFGLLGSAGLSAETVAGYLIVDATGVEVDELVVTENTYFTFIYQMRGADVSEQSKLVIGVRVTDEVVSSPDSSSDGSADAAGIEPEVVEPVAPAVARYEVFDYSMATSIMFDYSALENGILYINSVTNFDISRIPHSYEYDSIARDMSTMMLAYNDVDTSIANKFKVYCIPKSFIFMQALDYEDGADMSAYAGEYVLVLEPKYESYTDEIYRSEDVLILPLIDDVNAFAEEISDEAKSECDFLMDESFDDESSDIDDFYGSMEILMRLADTEDIFIFDDVLNTEVVDYCDMGTPDNIADDIPWDDYESGIINGNSQASSAETGAEQGAAGSSEVVGGSVNITETTTSTTTESVIQAINEDVANSFRSRHPELFTFFPVSEQIYSKWDWRIDDNTTVKGTITLGDGTIIPELSVTDSGKFYNITDGTTTSYGTAVTPVGPSVTSSSVFDSSSTTSSSTTTSSGSTTLGDEGYDTSEPKEEEEYINEYEISRGNTTCKVVANNTYRYMIDNQNSSSSQVYVNHKDKRYTIKVVDENEYTQYWTKDYLSRSLNGYSIVSSNYTGSTDANNNSIVLMNIQYNNGTTDVVEPYMAYIRNGSEYIIIIPDEAEQTGSDTLADILKRCVSL